MLDDAPAVTALWSARGPRWARAFYALAYPGVAAVVKRMYKTHDPEAVEQAKQRFLRAVDALDATLENQAYLGGDAPDRLDLAVSALFAPVCRPKEHRVRWPKVPEKLSAFEAALRDRPTWNHVLRMYRAHRTAQPAA